MFDILLQLLTLLGIDLLLAGLFVLALIPLSKFRQATYAVLKRNFIGYFSNPTGYAFLCVFVLLTSFAAFWPHEFFNSNMANLDQLNSFLPFIMLVFIPAITMSIWAEERHEGTDELLLTIPAGDFDIVLGKYLAAASIFTASLVFSQLSNFMVLNGLALGHVDMGLFFSTYLGYWFLGLAMLAIGMMASFLTGNLTVGFILGALFNAPLAFVAHADVVIPRTNLAQSISRWSYTSRLEDFGRGVVSLSSVVYFAVLITLGIYFSVVLIGRRHWLGGRDGKSLLGHYVIRSASLLALAIALCVLTTDHDLLRWDISSQKISSLSPATYERLDELSLKRPIRIEAYISGTLPEAYVRTKFDLISLLRELDAKHGGKIDVHINENVEPHSNLAKLAGDRYGIRPTEIITSQRGNRVQKQIFLSAAFTSGPETVVVPFFGLSSSVEYELVRSIVTLAESVQEASTEEQQGDDEKKAAPARRKVIGILQTRAAVNGIERDDVRAMMMGIRTGAKPQLFAQQLGKQYTLKEIAPGPNNPVKLDDYDVLLAVQPSSLEQAGIDYLVEAIRSGKPTAIFEDPAPRAYGIHVSIPGSLRDQILPVPGTDDPLPPSPMERQRMMMGMPPGRRAEKGDLTPLWDLLGVRLLRSQLGTVQQARPNPLAGGFGANSPASGKKELRWQPYTATVYQKYNPYPKITELGDGVIFASTAVFGKQPAFQADQPAVSGLYEVLFLFPGAVREKRKEDKSAAAKQLEFIPLVRLGGETGLISPAFSGFNPEGIYLKEIENDQEDALLKLQSEMQSRGQPPQPGWSEWKPTLKESLQDSRLASGSNLLPTQDSYVMAARIRSKPPEKEKGKKKKAADKQQRPQIDIVLVSDIDVLETGIMTLRDQPEQLADFRFQNRAFAMNLIDMLAGEERFLEIRSRQTNHAPLKLIENRVREASDALDTEKKQLEAQLNQQIAASQAKGLAIVEKIEQKLKQLQSQQKLDDNALRDARQELRMQQKRNAEDLQTQQERFNRQRQNKEDENKRQLNEDRLQIQSRYKIWAVVLPPIPPLLVGLAVFVFRRIREKEGVSRARLR